VEHAFRVGGKVAERKVDVGQAVREGDILAVLDDADYRLAEEATRQQLLAATAQARQAESDRKRLEALKTDGSVSAADEEKAQTRAQETRAAAEAEERKLELARNRLKYTVLRASRSGVVSGIRLEVGQVVAEGQPVATIAGEGEPEIMVDVPEDHLAAFKAARFKASLASAPDESFDVVLRELSPQAAAQTRTYRARLKPAKARPLPLGATAMLVSSRTASGPAPAAPVPASAITQANGQPAVWVVRRTGAEPAGTVELARIAVHGYRNEEALVSGLPAGELIVTAGIQKMAPGLQVALPAAVPAVARNEVSR
jgi:RND family efflux transporter MFP subunit